MAMISTISYMIHSQPAEIPPTQSGNRRTPDMATKRTNPHSARHGNHSIRRIHQMDQKGQIRSVMNSRAKDHTPRRDITHERIRYRDTDKQTKKTQQQTPTQFRARKAPHQREGNMLRGQDIFWLRRLLAKVRRDSALPSGDRE